MLYRWLVGAALVSGWMAPLCAAATDRITVDAVQPDVQVRAAGGAWEPAQRGMVLTPGHEVACDPDWTCTLRFADNSTVVVQPLTQLRIAAFARANGVVRTEIELR